MPSTETSRATRTGREPAVAIVGTFDVANFGDLLFPELARVELAQRLGGIRLRRFSHRAMAAPPWPYPVEAVDALGSSLEGVRLLIVGGGHLVRFDKAVAPGYGPTAGRQHHPTAYWLAPTLLASAMGVPVAWNAVGVSPGTPDWARPLVVQALDITDYVSVRDGPSLEELQRLRAGAAVVQVPDTAFGAPRVASEAQSAAGPILRDLGIDRPYVVVQPTAHLRPVADKVRSAAAAAREAGQQVVELPVGPVLGDRVGLLDLESAVAVQPWPDPLAMVGLISGAEAVIGHSLHLTIVAISAGVPVFRLADREGSKYDAVARFSSVHLIDAATEDLPERFSSARREAPAPDVVEQLAQLDAHWDRIASVSESVPPVERGRAFVVDLITRLPSVLEQLHEADREVLVRSVETASELTARVRELEARGEELASERDGLEHRVRELESALSGEQAAHAHSERMVAEATAGQAHLHERLDQLQRELSQSQQQAASDRRLQEEELALRDAKLVDASRRARELATTERRLGKVQSDLDRLRRRRSVRLALRVATMARRVIRVASFGRLPRAPRTSSGATGSRGANAPRAPDTRHASEAEARALADQLKTELPSSTRAIGPMVSIITPTRDGIEHLSRLVPALERTTYRRFELIVVDNGSSDASLEYLETAPRSFDLRIVRNEVNRSFSEACNQGLAESSGELVLLLNNDIEPVTPSWLGRMVTTLEETDAAAVGARLIYPRRPGLDNAGDVRRPDLTLQHRGIGFVPADGVPTGVNLGNGEDPRSALASGTREVVALTAACLLVRRSALTAVGGLTEGYVYGTEDVDLCLKLRADGGRLMYDGGAALWHHEYGTQNTQGREWKRENRRRNRQLFVDRWGPQLFREVFLDRVRGDGRWSEKPLHVAITLTRDDPAAGWGDYYTAKELGEACQAIGWQVSYLERYRDRWYDIDPSVDVVISLLDALDIRRLPRRVVTVAWIRNWTHRWIGHPWFDDYDLVLASSRVSQRLVSERTSKVAQLMPLATNPDRFQPRSPSSDLVADLVFVGNYWGEARGVLERLGRLSGAQTVAVWGRGWDQTILARHHRGELAYERLPEAYSSASIVIDDTAGPTKPYAAVNARVFDALASGAVVLSDNRDGIAELFDDDFPVAEDGAAFEAWVERLLADPSLAGELSRRYRAIVFEQHTYAHRARQVQAELIRWAEAERFGILIGARDWERAQSWGDYHYARSLQRELEARGHPARVEILPDWEGPAAARADVVIHLFGLTEYRTRLAQVSVLWNISHPDLVKPSACERYDHVFVASEPFAAKLAPKVRVPVAPLHQATDPKRFYPEPSAPAHDLLFVGNSRNIRRKIIDDLLPTSHDLAIYGMHWGVTGVDPVYVKGEYIPNDVLHRYYSAARIVLADHWDDMRREGFLSNRLYDALASGAFVISDTVTGIDAEFGGAVVTYDDADDLREKVDAYLADEDARRERGELGRRVVLERHTFAQRTETIVAVARALLERDVRAVEDWRRHDVWLRRRHAHPAGEAPSATSPGLEAERPVAMSAHR